MTDESHELALTIINDGDGYDHRCRIARLGVAPAIAIQFGHVARLGARKYLREFPPSEVFSAVDILLAAVELCEYYEQHIKEIDAA